MHPICSTYARRLVLLLVGLLLTMTTYSPARASGCDVIEPQGTPTMTAADTLRALIVFARFPDGEDVDATGTALPACENCGDGWSATDVYPPSWAEDLIEDTESPSVPGSLTHLFHTLSRGKHILKGAILDTVLVSDSTLVYWRGAGADTLSGSLKANKRLLATQVDNLVDFSDYEESGERVDYVFIMWHSCATYDESISRYYTVYGGISWLLVPGQSVTLDTLTFGYEHGSTISSVVEDAMSGAHINDIVTIRHRWQTLALAAHEYGHDLLSIADSNANHLRSVGRYCIMQGNIVPASFVPSAWLRRELGWLTPPVDLDLGSRSAPFDTTLTLSTSYDDHGALAIIRNSDVKEDQYFLLEAKEREKSGEPYNRIQPADQPSCCTRSIDQGRGLLVTHITESATVLFTNEPALPANTIPLMDVEVATGRFNVSTRAPDAVSGRDYIDQEWDEGGATGRAGDLFFPVPLIDRTNVFAPYSNPSTHFYRNDGTAQKTWQDAYSGITLYNIEFIASNDSMRVKIHYDGITKPADADTIKVDTKWQALVQLMNDVVVKEGVTLEVAEGATIVGAAAQDGYAGLADTTRVELLINGRLDVEPHRVLRRAPYVSPASSI